MATKQPVENEKSNVTLAKPHTFTLKAEDVKKHSIRFKADNGQPLGVVYIDRLAALKFFGADLDLIAEFEITMKPVLK